MVKLNTFDTIQCLQLLKTCGKYNLTNFSNNYNYTQKRKISMKFIHRLFDNYAYEGRKGLKSNLKLNHNVYWNFRGLNYDI
jgi:hypothetical protein